jgi:polyisoprenoid-binding protein YceI
VSHRNFIPLTLFVIASLAAACAGGSPTTAPAAATAAGRATSPARSTASSDAIRLNLVADGTQARYRVREQLAALSFPSDAIGSTSAVTGSVVLNRDGTIVADQSKFVIDLTGLVSDKGQRDRFVQGNLLETRQYPTAEFDPSSVTGLAAPRPSSGPVTFQI